MWLSVDKKIYKKNPGGISDNLTAPFYLQFGVIIYIYSSWNTQLVWGYIPQKPIIP